MINLYNGAIGFLYMSRYEGFGLPVLEAMQCGVPVICSNAASLPEVAGDAAMLMDPSDDRQFVASLDRLYTEESVRERLLDTGLRQASRFSWEKYANEVVSAYEEM
jgi:alpha-1,3-rhamnosyl/mannosyltransferase